MKKLLGILVLGLLWCNVGFAATLFNNDECLKDLVIIIKHNKKEWGMFQTRIKNPSKNSIRIDRVEFLSADDEVIYEKRLYFVIKPYHQELFMLGDIKLMPESIKVKKFYCTYSY